MIHDYKYIEISMKWKDTEDIIRQMKANCEYTLEPTSTRFTAVQLDCSSNINYFST